MRTIYQTWDDFGAGPRNGVFKSLLLDRNKRGRGRETRSPKAARHPHAGTKNGNFPLKYNRNLLSVNYNLSGRRSSPGGGLAVWRQTLDLVFETGMQPLAET